MHREDGINIDSSVSARNKKCQPDKKCKQSIYGDKLTAVTTSIIAALEFAVIVEEYTSGAYLERNGDFMFDSWEHLDPARHELLKSIAGAIMTAVTSGVIAALEFVVIMEECAGGAYLERNEDFMVVC
ncbi:hypothetical protein CHS0354_005347 [Potamilus streckersoni]|uniref:Uncharacterized protein n=1 Tax=Potamilus streckersoni TaxID=2493646 RepID=A0AAE0VWA7_9BIVA|nr:hypothetical protein CHS0354_005347 [Potamilus streckersoni]